jgi:uncharacterized protein DUF6941
MRILLLLADHAQVAEGKLFVSGGGWSVTGPAPTPGALAIKIDLPWDRTNVRHRVQVELVDADGHPVTIATGMGTVEPVQVGCEFETGRPPGMKPGTPIDVPLAFNYGPLPLAPDSQFTWQLWFDGDTHEDWQVSFTTRPLPAS